MKRDTDVPLHVNQDEIVAVPSEGISITQYLLPSFTEALIRFRTANWNAPEFLLGSEGKYSLRFIPFESVNLHARLVIVGITPGINQIKLAYGYAQKHLKAGAPHREVSVAAKREGAFGGPIRGKLVEMLRHFGIAGLLGIRSEESLWEENAGLLEATSVVPHAAFKNDKMFAGKFDEILSSRLLRECFENCFVPSLLELPRDVLYIPLGRMPQDALKWCASRGIIAADAAIAPFPHPSGTSGSQVSYYLKERRCDELHPKDPVRNRLDWLDEAYVEAGATIAHLRTVSDRHGAPGVVPTKENEVALVQAQIHSESRPKSLLRQHQAASSVPSSSNRSNDMVARAESHLASIFGRIKAPTRYIAGFRTERGTELALERERQEIYLWLAVRPPEIPGTAVVNRANPGMPYSVLQKRNSNLRSQAPSLWTGNRAWYVRIADMAVLGLLGEWLAAQ